MNIIIKSATYFKDIYQEVGDIIVDIADDGRPLSQDEQREKFKQAILENKDKDYLKIITVNEAIPQLIGSIINIKSKNDIYSDRDIERKELSKYIDSAKIQLYFMNQKDSFKEYRYNAHGFIADNWQLGFFNNWDFYENKTLAKEDVKIENEVEITLKAGYAFKDIDLNVNDIVLDINDNGMPRTCTEIVQCISDTIINNKDKKSISFVSISSPTTLNYLGELAYYRKNNIQGDDIKIDHLTKYISPNIKFIIYKDHVPTEYFYNKEGYIDNYPMGFYS